MGFGQSGQLFKRLGMVGVAGYSIYALHAPLIIFLLVLGVGALATFFITLAISLLAYLFFERPLSNMGRRASQGCAGSLAVAVVDSATEGELR